MCYIYVQYVRFMKIMNNIQGGSSDKNFYILFVIIIIIKTLMYNRWILNHQRENN